MIHAMDLLALWVEDAAKITQQKITVNTCVVDEATTHMCIIKLKSVNVNSNGAVKFFVKRVQRPKLSTLVKTSEDKGPNNRAILEEEEINLCDKI